MKMLSSFTKGLVLTTGMISFLFTGNLFAQSISKAPLNPDFTNYLKAAQAGKVQTLTADWHYMGHVPGPIDYSHMKGINLNPVKGVGALSYPVSYDLRTTGKLTPVRDQANCGSCWTFGAFGSMESNLKPGETWDFSENNLKNTHGFTWGPCDGGNRYMAVAYLTRWSGAIAESDDPYSDSSISNSPAGLVPRKHLQDVFFIPDRSSFTDNDNLKYAIMNYGAVQISMCWDWASYNATYKSHYFSGSSSTNHDICIVGWDDNFSSTKFNTTAPGNGAFIVRNSWNTTWGDGGYFYLSYYDTEAPLEASVYRVSECPTNYSKVYQYDPLGLVNTLGYGKTYIWGGNIFTAESTEYVKAVSSYADTPYTTYTVRVYTGVGATPNTGTLACEQYGTVTNAGYFTIDLNTLVKVTANQKFSAVIGYNSPGSGYPYPFEYAEAGYSDAASASAGQSFYSPDGSSWYELTGYEPTGNCCIKAFTIRCDTTQQVICKDQGEQRFHLMTYGSSTDYTPVSLYVNSLTSNDTVTVTVNNAKHPNASSPYYISRWYRIQHTGGISNANLTLRYTDPDFADVGGGISESALQVAKYSGSSWSYYSPSTLDTTGNSALLNGVTSFSDWTLSGPTGVPVELSGFEIE
jgi:C1A family cysteine protease